MSDAGGLEIDVETIGIAAPGLQGWPQARSVLNGSCAYQASEPPAFKPAFLPPNELRRAPAAVRQAFRAAEEAMAGSVRSPSQLATVFASSEADVSIVHRIGLALAGPARVISPTDFHNSVHNAAAGYWSIATGSRAPSSAISAYDATFAAGLLEAAAMVICGSEPVLLVAYDVPVPDLLHLKRPIEGALSIALLLAPAGSTAACARLRIRRVQGASTPMSEPQLERLRLHNPVGRALPLVRQLALGSPGEVRLESAGDGALAIAVAPL